MVNAMNSRHNRFEQGQHVCVLFETVEEHLAIAAGYIAEGLRSGEQCLYGGHSSHALKQFQGALRDEGIDAVATMKRGALVTATTARLHLAGGTFDSERMLGLLNEAVEAALNAGYKGLRACGDMSWLLDYPEAEEQVVKYEALLNGFFSSSRAVGMCLYDRRRLPSALVDHGIATHSTVVIDGEHKPNHFYESPAAAARRSPAQRMATSAKIAGLQQRA